MSGAASLVLSGPVLLAMPVAAAAGALTFLSPCVLPLVPGYLSYVTGMSGVSAESAETGLLVTGSGEHAGDATAVACFGMDAATTAVAAPAITARSVASRRRVVGGTALFVLGFSALFASYGVAFGSIGPVLLAHQKGLEQVLGAVVVALGLMFSGIFDRFSFAGRIVKPSFRPRAGLASAPLLGVLFGLGWSPCTGPTLGAVLTLDMTAGTAARGALLAFVYGLGIGIPFLIVAFAMERGVALFGFARRHARIITRTGGLMLISVGVLEVSGAWSAATVWMQVHWLFGYNLPL